MGDKSKIEWTDATWNPVTGCTKVSAGCKFCYAEREFPRVYPGRAFTEVKVHEERLEIPLRWRRPRRVFVNSMSDLFHESIPGETIAKILGVCGQASQHIFQVLTKRPQRMKDLILDICSVGACVPPSNLWLGVSVEDQKTANERIVLLLQTPAAVRWVSYEPALGPVDFRPYLPYVVTLPMCMSSAALDSGATSELIPGIDWIVAGGESGPKARPSHPDWFTSVRDQCQEAEVPFFFKQWGEWIPGAANGFTQWPEVDNSRPLLMPAHPGREGRDNHQVMLRVGKKQAGRLLDGREWNEYPITQGGAR